MGDISNAHETTKTFRYIIQRWLPFRRLASKIAEQNQREMLTQHLWSKLAAAEAAKVEAEEDLEEGVSC